jgi:hypothetical protein
MPTGFGMYQTVMKRMMEPAYQQVLADEPDATARKQLISDNLKKMETPEILRMHGKYPQLKAEAEKVEHAIFQQSTGQTTKQESQKKAADYESMLVNFQEKERVGGRRRSRKSRRKTRKHRR